MRFDLKVGAGGYAWWYVDALSDDGQFGLTMIAFVGSVFSPYYAWSGRGRPDNHCALNVALYGPRAARWSMTERGANRIARSATHFQIGPNALSWRNGTLEVDVADIAMPFPSPVRGKIRVHTDGLGESVYFIDDQARHRWRPMAPSARVEIDFASPSIKWSGDGYFDANDGDEPLEAAFDYWDWSRTTLGDGRTAILYNTDMCNGAARSASLIVNAEGVAEAFDAPPAAPLDPTPIWRIGRRTCSAVGAPPKVVKTFEDTPFYSRSHIESTVYGGPRPAIHESLVGSRLRSGVVKALLPFRMPRLP